MADWMPIESAPTWKWEGDKNIALGHRPEIIAGWAPSGYIGLAYWSPVHEDKGGGGRWMVIGVGALMEPTHWMELPKPPAP